MGISGMLMDLVGEKDPMLAMLARMGGGGAGATQQAPGATQDGTGTAPAMLVAPGPGAAPAMPAPATPTAYQSPPELMELYTQLMKRQNQEQVMDAGFGLIASGLAGPGSAKQVFNAVSGQGRTGGGRSDPMSTIQGMMKMQESQRLLQERAASRAALPAIAKQYNLDMPTATYLFDTGKLDTVLSEMLKPDQQLTETADGRKVIVNIKTGAVSDPFGPTKPQELEIKTGADGRTYAYDKITGKQVGGGQGPAKPDEFEFRTDDQGNQFAVNKSTGIRAEGNIATGSGVTNDDKNWKVANADRVARGLPEIGFGEFLITNKRAGAGAANVGPNNIDYGKPPKDYQWDRDANGALIIENGVPKATIIAGSQTDLKNTKAGDQKDKKEGQQALASTFVGQSIDDILANLDKNKDSFTTPTTGLTGQIASMLDSSEAGYIKNTLDTVKANIGFEKLQSMRDGSPTGAALGPVSDFENKLLQSVFGSLNQGQKDEYFVRNLMRVKFMTDAIVNSGVKDQADSQAIMKRADEASAEFTKKLRGGKPKEEKKPEDAAAAPTGPTTEDLLKKYGVGQ